MVDIGERLKEIREIIGLGEYFNLKASNHSAGKTSIRYHAKERLFSFLRYCCGVIPVYFLKTFPKWLCE